MPRENTHSRKCSFDVSAISPSELVRHFLVRIIAKFHFLETIAYMRNLPILEFQRADDNNQIRF